ncbi:MAG: AAA family ATPase [bacterium]|nr:AAA family ATPase [bacterium]
MASASDADLREVEFRRRWYEAHARRARADIDRGHFEEWLPGFWSAGAEALKIRNRLASSRDLERFRADLLTWAIENDVGFKGPAGGMFINSLVKHTDDPAESTRLLVNGLTPPPDRESAATQIDMLVHHVNRIQVGAKPAPLSAAFVLSYFWALEQPRKWPIFWPNDRKFLDASMGLKLSGSPTERYLEFVDLVAVLDEDCERFAMVSSWWVEKRPVFLDPVLVDRCAYGRDPEAIPPESLRNNAAALVGIAKHLRDVLAEDVAEVVEHLVKVEGPPPEWKKGRPRSDLWANWRVPDSEIGLRLWINDQGAAIGVIPGYLRHRRGWTDEARGVVDQNGVEGFRLMATRGSRHGDDVGFLGRSGSFIYGRWYEAGQLTDLDLTTEVVDVATAARPLLDALVSRARSEDPTNGPPEPEGQHGNTEEGTPPDPIDTAAADLLVDRSFLNDIVELLRDKGQVILYGPPGTGKTYLAQRLAAALAPKNEDWTLVQFHPSTSYEDFFEGYRPEEGPDGQIVYRLTPGPLARMAERAAQYPQRRQVMVIDEINRANLPKVLGELLFLFEYRDRSVSTLYRPEGEFELPESLWFIGTMNTADRSIALVDAALRRRFHFVPFFPDRGPTEGLLERWLEREGQPSWVGELLAMVNKELTDAIGADLQLGPSHFMKQGYLQEPDTDDTRLRRIWEYNIEPLIEDQLFGDPDRIERFRFENVVARCRSSSGLGDFPADSEATGDRSHPDV